MRFAGSYLYETKAQLKHTSNRPISAKPSFLYISKQIAFNDSAIMQSYHYPLVIL